MEYTSNTNDDKKPDATNLITILTIAISVFCLAIWTHIKVIKLSKREKDMTWKLDTTNSCLIISIIVHRYLMHGITFIIQDLYLYTGKWFCYASKVLDLYGNLYMTAYSFIVASLKYVFIVRWEKVRDIGKEKTKTIFFWINLLHPIFTIILHLINRPDFLWAYDGFPQFDRCLGDPKENWSRGGNNSLTKLHNLCEFDEPFDNDLFEISVLYCRSTFCWLLVVTYYLVLLNILEILFYISIFRFTRR